MPTKRLLPALMAGVAGIALHAVPAVAQNAPALAGQVTSEAEGAMEGVVVSAKKTGSTVMVSVISDAKGHYSFPANRLEPGEYAVVENTPGKLNMQIWDFTWRPGAKYVPDTHPTAPDPKKH